MKKIEGYMNQQLEICDWCGESYDSNSVGHDHFEDGGCECVFCSVRDDLKGKKFCSQECECHYVQQNLN